MDGKLHKDLVKQAVSTLLSQRKPRNFTEAVDLQIGLKDYDTSKDRRFNGSVVLPFISRPNLKMCLIGDAQHKLELEREPLANISFID